MLADSPGEQNPLTYLLREAFDSLVRQMMVCLPGKVLTFNPDDQTAQVECGIQRLVNGRGVTIPPIERVPVHFPGNGQWYVWHEITPGTEGLIHFSQRAIDTWLEQGGPVAPHDTRMFAAADAFFVPGVRSRPGKIPGFKNEGVGLSDYAGETFIHLTPGAIAIKTGALTIEADSIEEISMAHTIETGALSETSQAHTIESGALTINAPITASSSLAVAGALTNAGVNVGKNHKHPYSWTSGAGNSVTGDPQ